MFSILKEITPRDIGSLKKLKAANVKFIELKVAPQTQAIGKKVSSLDIPAEAVIMAIGRGDYLLFPSNVDELCVNDIIFLLTSNKHEAFLKNLFTAPAQKFDYA